MGDWHVLRRDYLSFGFSLQVWDFMQVVLSFVKILYNVFRVTVSTLSFSWLFVMSL